MTRRRFAFLLLLLLAGYVFWTWDGSAPQVSWPEPRSAYGKKVGIDLLISDQGGGLKEVRVEIKQKENTQEVFSEEYRALGWFDRVGTPRRSVAISLQEVGLEQGEFEIVVRASDQPILGFWSRSSEVSKKLFF